MNSVPTVNASIIALPVMSDAQITAAASRIEQCLVHVINAERGDGIGRRVSDRYPERRLAVSVLGMEAVKRLCPEASMPSQGDHTALAACRIALYASTGALLLTKAPAIDESSGPLAAASVVNVLYYAGGGDGSVDREKCGEALELINAASNDHGARNG